MGRCSIQGHICKYLPLVSNIVNLLYLLLLKFNLICSVSFNCIMSSPSDWLRPDYSRPNRMIGALLIAHLLVTTRYMPRRLRSLQGVNPWYGDYLQQAIFSSLCIWRIYMIECMHLMNQCRSSLIRRQIGGTQSCTSDTRRRKRNRGNRCSP